MATSVSEENQSTDWEVDIVHGNKNVYGISVGIIMLETSFPRILGDIGNAKTFDFPVNYAIVNQSSAYNTVKELSEGKLDNFIATAKGLEKLGVGGITTNCGYLASMQEELNNTLSIPVATSSLLQFQMIQATLPKDKVVGIITFDKEALVERVLDAAGVPIDTPILGMDKLELNRVILDDENQLDVKQVEVDMVLAAKQLVVENPQVGAILLECTNMAPYATAMQRAVGLPIFSIVSLVNWFHSGLLPPSYPIGL